MVTMVVFAFEVLETTKVEKVALNEVEIETL